MKQFLPVILSVLSLTACARTVQKIEQRPQPPLALSDEFRKIAQQPRVQSSQAASSVSSLPIVYERADENLITLSPLYLTIRHVGNMKITQVDSDFFEVNPPYQYSIERIPYDQLWEGFAEAVRKQQSCEPWRYVHHMELPVETQRPMRCEVIETSSGITVVIAVGYKWLFESSDFPGSMMLILRDNDALLIDNPVQFPLLSDQINDIEDAFYEQYPEADLWPPDGPGEQEIYDSIEQLIASAVKQPSIEVQYAMEVLTSLAHNISVSP